MYDFEITLHSTRGINGVKFKSVTYRLDESLKVVEEKIAKAEVKYQNCLDYFET